MSSEICHRVVLLAVGLQTSRMTLLPSFTLKMEAARSSETLVSYYNTTQQWSPFLWLYDTFNFTAFFLCVCVPSCRRFHELNRPDFEYIGKAIKFFQVFMRLWDALPQRVAYVTCSDFNIPA